MGGTVLHVNAVGLMAAVEEAKDPGLRTRPFVVAREAVPRSIVLDLSPEAHREGIRRGMMLSLALRHLPRLAVRQPRPELYRAADEALWRNRPVLFAPRGKGRTRSSFHRPRRHLTALRSARGPRPSGSGCRYWRKPASPPRLRPRLEQDGVEDSHQGFSGRADSSPFSPTRKEVSSGSSPSNSCPASGRRSRTG